MRSPECIACTERTRTTQPYVDDWEGGGGKPFGWLADRQPPTTQSTDSDTRWGGWREYCVWWIYHYSLWQKCKIALKTMLHSVSFQQNKKLIAIVVVVLIVKIPTLKSRCNQVHLSRLSSCLPPMYKIPNMSCQQIRIYKSSENLFPRQKLISNWDIGKISVLLILTRTSARKNILNKIAFKEKHFLSQIYF